MSTSANPVITAWSAISPYGIGRQAFEEGVGSGRVALTPCDRKTWGTRDEVVGLVPDFDLRAVLGKKGTKAMSRVTGLALATTGDLLKEIPQDHRAGLVLGTTAGSLQTTMEFTRTSLAAQFPHHVDAAVIPYTVMNASAARCAIWYGLKGPNSTIAGGRPTALHALGYARRLIRAGRAETVLCGAAEEYSRARSWFAYHDRAGSRPVLGEGCAMFALQAGPGSEGEALAELVAVDTRISPTPDRTAETVEAAVRRVLAAAPDGAEVWTACPSGADDSPGRQELSVLADLFGSHVLTHPLPSVIGDAGSASAAFQLAQVLSRARRDPSAAGRLAVITSVDVSGPVAAVLLRLSDRRGNEETSKQ
ncbi:beta-ketoacyl synthase N-terminal-like domain-containing protein [Streptomyces sp. RerS4]|uniref:beta-ketoacyl synthase N-terminal-like domain-containing protein n=1 Tax=Streptomyces sp. RerS4 TaxID=2942449 RepID=UPI00201C656A|nr:beta-ketoacyl synthase N-terminal-like domain-containing protein [Streptomyces sp. RerS4]UQX03438.1 3-oxoacyl-ACP synthase [Streptomyces sp. RerS4]